MQYITIQPAEFNELLKQLEEIKKEIAESKKKNSLSETWLDISDTCRLLNISKRLLQDYRTNGILSFSQFQSKIWFKASDLNSFLESNYRKAFKKRN